MVARHERKVELYRCAGVTRDPARDELAVELGVGEVYTEKYHCQFHSDQAAYKR